MMDRSPPGKRLAFGLSRPGTTLAPSDARPHLSVVDAILHLELAICVIVLAFFANVPTTLEMWPPWIRPLVAPGFASVAVALVASSIWNKIRPLFAREAPP